LENIPKEDRGKKRKNGERKRENGQLRGKSMQNREKIYAKWARYELKKIIYPCAYKNATCLPHSWYRIYQNYYKIIPMFKTEALHRSVFVIIYSKLGI
jgi:hypothetical protein